MKLLYVVSGQSYFSEDPGRKIQALVRCWREMGHEVEFLCGGDILAGSRRSHVRDGQANQANPPWYRRQAWLSPVVESASELLNIQHDRALATEVAGRLERFQPDLYWQRSSRLDGTTFATARRAGVPTVLEWKDNLLALYRVSLFKPWAHFVERRKDASANWLVVESGVLRDQLAPRRRDGVTSILVAHNAIDPADFPQATGEDRRAARTLAGIPEDEFVALYVGSFAWYHHVEVLIDAVAHARDAGVRVRAVLVGEGLGRPAAERIVIERGLGDQVTFIGRVPYSEVPRWLAAADATILPDCTDIITPIKVQEYMAMGSATVIPDYPANREVVDDGRSGLLFAPRNAEALGEQLVRLARDPSLRSEMGNEARRVALARFSWRATWGETLEEIGRRAGILADADPKVPGLRRTEAGSDRFSQRASVGEDEPR